MLTSYFLMLNNGAFTFARREISKIQEWNYGQRGYGGKKEKEPPETETVTSRPEVQVYDHCTDESAGD